MKRILLTSAGTGTAFSYATAIVKNFPELEIFTADINTAEYVTASLFAKKHFTVPLSIDPCYQATIERIIIDENIDFYLPLIDTDIKNAYKSNLLSSKLVANNKYFCDACIQKDNYHSWAHALQIKTPKLYSNINLIGNLTVVLKKNGGFGSRDTKITKIDAIDKLNFGEISVYEFIDGEEYTIDCFPTNTGVITTVRKRVEVKNGVCVKAVITKNDTLNKMADKIVNYFSLEHPFCFQVIENDDNYYLIDVNPRLGAGTALGTITGKDYFSAHVAYILHHDVHLHLKEHLQSCVVTRQYSDYLMKIL